MNRSGSRALLPSFKESSRGKVSAPFLHPPIKLGVAVDGLKDSFISLFSGTKD